MIAGKSTLILISTLLEHYCVAGCFLNKLHNEFIYYSYEIGTINISNFFFQKHTEFKQLGQDFTARKW